MACKTCNKVVQNTDSGIDYRVRDGVVSVVANNGATLRITEPAVARPHQPRQGWQVTLVVNGQRVVVPGKSAVEVRNAAERLLASNGISISAKDLWFNLNIQWLQRTPERYRMVDFERYLRLSEAVDRVIPDKHTKGRLEVSEWLDSAMWFLGIYLSTEAYRRDRFLTMAEGLLSLCDPVESPLTGSSRLFSKVSPRVTALTKTPAFTRDEARDWFVGTLQTLPLNNTDNPATLADVATKYHWT